MLPTTRLRHLLTAKGYTVYEAKNCEEAVEVIERVQPDIALIDIGLPALDGFAVAKRLRQNRSLDDVVLIALTGYGTATDIEAARKAAEELADIYRGNVDAFVEAGRIATAGAQSIGQTWR